MIDMEYGKNIFDAWVEGSTDAEIWESPGYSANHGFSKEIRIPKAKLPAQEK